MADSPQVDDILGMLAEIEGRSSLADAQAGDHSETKVRLILATDWSSGAAPLAVLRAFKTMVPPSYPVQLAFATPHEPTVDDAECVQILLEGVGRAGELAGLEIVSFEEAGSAGYDSAVVPNGSADELLVQVAGLITRMYDVVRRLEAAGPGHVLENDPTLNVGNLAMLRHRFGGFDT